ncbi:hypothetical protein FNJ88_12340 [Chryseobacterium sp. SNU WT5]|uniref:hypothetical protein n=1 Tax=Chryseobacterium sp. SNU WT5 TaxID=2594269 RepID=UPI00117C14BA|nr:hypothetical protein [Chryseobacterium sp. SNU WT5]QDP86299.1 hypothetical protein FNJ88_12340 [Chryseobacterium sp. SNU WT5]
MIFIVSGSMLVYGLAKPIQFADFTTGPNSDLSEGHQVMWAFYSFTKTYPIIIGVLEVGGALALLHHRTRIFGSLLLTVILANIIIQNYLYEIPALRTAIFYQILVLAILAFDWQKLKRILLELLQHQKKERNLIFLIFAFIIAFVLKYFENKFLF